MRISGATFTGETITLDGKSYRGCRFVRCKIVYRGAAPTDLIENDFEDGDLCFEGPASHTMGFLKGLAASSDGFLLTFLKALELEPARLEKLASRPPGR
jgi:hypothetical protein